MKTPITISLTLAGALLLASCYVVPDNRPPRASRAELEKQKLEAEARAKAEEEEKKKKELAAKKKAEAQKNIENLKPSDIGAKGAGDTPPPPKPPTPTSGKPSYPTAKKAPGREGFVLSPYNSTRLIDVRGIASGKLVRDPTYDPSEKKFFRVP